MKSNYNKVGDFIRLVKDKNREGLYSELLGINIDKFFMPSVANIHGVDLSTYKVVRKDQFACNRMHVGRDYRIPISLSRRDEPFLVSPAYDVFEIKDTSILLPEYLMMWFSRKEFDRNAWFYTDADVRGGLPWSSFYEIEVPVPSIEKQREIVREYKTIINRISLNEQLIQKLEETAQAIYKRWFVEFEFPDENGNLYLSSGGKMVWCEELEKEIPEGWEIVELGCIADKITDGTHSTVIDDPLGDFHLLSCKNIKNNDIEITDKDRRINKETLDFLRKRTGLQINDLLLTTVGTIGEIAKVRISEIPYELQRSVAIIRANKHEITHEYLYQFFKTEWFKTQVEDKISGSVQRCLFLRAINEILVLKPSRNVEQNFNILSNDIELLLMRLKKQNRKLTEFSEVLLAKMTKIEETTEKEMR